MGLAVTALGVVAVVMPGWFGLTGHRPATQLVPFRAVLGIGLLALALAVAAVPGRRRARLAVVLVLVAGAVAQAGVLVGRGYGGAPSADEAADGATVVVLAFNTMAVVPPRELAALVVAQDADVVVLPETEQRTGETTAALLAEAGHPMTMLARRTGTSSATATVLLVTTRWGEYSVAELAPTRQATFRATATGGADDAPPLVAAHPLAPATAAMMPAWRSEGRWVVQSCRDTPGAIVAGDLNATLDHPQLRELGPCVDAAEQAGAAALGTWPSSAPRWLAAPIDHVLVDSRVWDVTGFAVLPATGGSDHRPIVAHLRRR